MTCINTDIVTQQKKSGWLSTIFLVFIFSAVIVYLLLEITFSVNQLVSIDEAPLYLVGSHNLIPLVFLIPSVLLLTVGLIMVELQKMTTELYNLSYKLIFISLIAFILARILYGGFFIDSYMSNHGYSYCNPLTSVSVLSPEIWVSDPAYCLEDSRNVSGEVQDWLDAKMAAGERPTAEEAEQHIKQLAQAYQARLKRF